MGKVAKSAKRRTAGKRGGHGSASISKGLEKTAQIEAVSKGRAITGGGGNEGVFSGCNGRTAKMVQKRQESNALWETVLRQNWNRGTGQ